MRSYMKKKLFVIHGGGKIGLGLMADILSQDKNDYEIIATSNNIYLNTLINNTPYFYLQHGPLINNNFTKVNSVTMVPRSTPTIIDLYKKASIVAICLTPEVFSKVAKDIAQALIIRAEEKNPETLKILVVMNKPCSEEFVYKSIYEEMTAQFKLKQKDITSIMSKIEFIPAVVDRIVTEIKIEAIQEKLRQQLKTIKPKNVYGFIDKSKSFAVQIEDIIANPIKLAAAIKEFKLQYNILNAEKEFNLFVPDSFLAKQFPSMKLVNNIGVFENIKNKYINGPHAILAWLGAILGCNTIAETIKYPGAADFIKDLMEKEICPILIAAHPDITKRELDTLKNSFIRRCEQSINDPVVRVGRNPSLKLNTGERIQGTLELREKYQLSISTSSLEYGIAAGIWYAVNNNIPTNPNCEKLISIYQNGKGSYKEILRNLGLGDDKVLIQNIITKIQQLEIFCEKRKIHQHYSTYSQLFMSKAILKTPLTPMARSLMSPQEKTFIQSLTTQQYKEDNLLQDPVRLNLSHPPHSIYISNKFATKSFLFNHTKSVVPKDENQLLPIKPILI